MHVRIRHWQWLISCAVFGVILIALALAAVLRDPLAASIP
jgi:hypothetical protein